MIHADHKSVALLLGVKTLRDDFMKVTGSAPEVVTSLSDEGARQKYKHDEKL